MASDWLAPVLPANQKPGLKSNMDFNKDICEWSEPPVSPSWVIDGVLNMSILHKYFFIKELFKTYSVLLLQCFVSLSCE